MANIKIGDGAVEAAAKAYVGEAGWSDLAPMVRRIRIKKMQKALESATPDLLRSVWDEAYGRGFEAARGYPDTPNPYEATPTR